MRYCDDLSDAPGAGGRRAAIERWREDLGRALAGGQPEHPLWPAFQDTVQRCAIPPDYFYQIIEGVSSDLEPRRTRSFEELYRYCYQVSSIVGLSVIHVLGFESVEAPTLAEKCGIAFQLTNILRDVGEDAAGGRIYLPAEDLERFGVEPGQLSGTARSREFVELMRFEAARARTYYEEARPLIGLVDRSGRPMLGAIIAIYSALLDRIEASGFDVLGRRVSLPAWKKLWLMLEAAAGPWNKKAG